MSNPKLSLDPMGALASVACAVHCALMAFAPAVLPALGLGLLVDELAEWVFVGFAVAFAGWAGITMRDRPWLAGAFALGAFLLLGARFGEEFGIEGWPLALLGGAVLVGSHYRRFAVCRSCEEESCSTG